MPALAEPVDECPICHAQLEADAAECPRCGEGLAPNTFSADGLPEGSRPERGFREKLLYYLGIALILLGGPGIALGSWLHDVLRISYLNYNAFDVFGPMNRLVVAVGLIVMIVGVVFLVVSLRLTRPAVADPA